MTPSYIPISSQDEEMEDDSDEEEEEDADDDEEDAGMLQPDSDDEDDDQWEDVEGGDDAEEGDGVLDPRAGRVDVTIPQLENIDFAKLSEELFKAGEGKGVGGPQRAALYRWVKNVRSMEVYE